MDRIRLRIEIKVGKDQKTRILAITSIETPQGEVYWVPEEHQSIYYNSELVKTEAFKRIRSTLTLWHQSRWIWAKLEKELRIVYTDKEENIMFYDQYLEEVTNKSQRKIWGQRRCHTLEVVNRKGGIIWGQWRENSSSKN